MDYNPRALIVSAELEEKSLQKQEIPLDYN